MEEACLCLKPHLTAQGQHLLYSVPAKEWSACTIPTAGTSQSFTLVLLGVCR